MSGLDSIRQEIDSIDSQLIKLFIKRMDCAKKVGEYKKENNIPVLNVAREKEILDTVEVDGGEYGYASRLLFSNIMELSRALQHDMLGSGKKMREELENASGEVFDKEEKGVKVACQGIVGANSHEATTVIFPNGEPVFVKSWEDVFEAVESGEVSYGVLPVENSSAGSVADVYDLILKYNFYIASALDLKIEHSLCGLKQSEFSDIEQVWSHPQGLAQCSNFTNEHNLKTVPFSNTAVAAQAVAQEKRLNCAAICSKKAGKEYGLKVLKTDFQNSADNCTRFIVISKKLLVQNNSSKISLCFALPHITGSLYNVLQRFSSNGLNLTKIESRPIPNSNFEYLFYLDFTGNVQNERTVNLLCALSEEMPYFSFFGNYLEL